MSEEEWYARADSNGRPFTPEVKNINHYEHRLLNTKDLRMRVLDPDGPKFGGFRRFGPCPDPPRWLAFHVLSRVRARSRSEFLTKIMLLREDFQIAI